MATTQNRPATIAHGGRLLPDVVVDDYNEEIRDSEGFIGDHASRGAFRDILDSWRKEIAGKGEDPFGNRRTDQLTKDELDKYLDSKNPDVVRVVQSAVSEFAQELAKVTCRFLRTENWKGTEHIVVGGGLSGSHIGQLAIEKASMLVHDGGQAAKMSAITHAPDVAGLLGGTALAPAWMLKGHDAIISCDIGGTNLRVGIIELERKKKAGKGPRAWKYDLWRHKEDAPSREDFVQRMSKMIRRLIEEAEAAKLRVAPFVAIGCPGRIAEDGTIEQGAQNLPGNWEDRNFSLADALAGNLPRIDGHELLFVIHNDAVVQGLSEVANMRKFAKWGVLTIGTGLGNARFTNR
jgi:hypothetical protein